MMLGNAKKTNHHRCLSDFPEWQSAIETRDRLQAEAKAAAEQCRRADGPGMGAPTAQDNRIGRLVGSLLGRPEVELPDQASAAEKREAVRAAAEQHNRTMNDLQIRLSQEIYGDWSNEHRAARRLIVEKTLELKAAFDDELRLAHKIFVAGGGMDLGLRPWFNTSACGHLRSMLGGMNGKAFRETNRNLLT